MSFYAAPAPFKGYKLSDAPEKDLLMSIAEPLPIHQRMDTFDEEVAYFAQAVTEHNSTYVEAVDRNYAVRGVAAALGWGGFGFILYNYIDSFLLFLTKGNNPALANYDFGFFDHLYHLVLLGVLFFILRVDCFRYTHYPVRFNRKNRQVYVWRKNGSVWKVGWDELFFFIRRVDDMGSKDHDLSAVLFEKDSQTTVEEGVNIGTLHSVDPELVRGHFEFFRRYMEDGPEQTHRMLTKCMPVSKRRETWFEGYCRMMAELGGHFSSFILMILMQPFFIPVSIGRWIAMHTCRIPKWPEWVEQECAIEPNDPYVREAGYVYKADKKS